MSDVGENGRVTARQLYRAVDDAKEVLEQEIDNLRRDVQELRDDIADIRRRLNHRNQWLGGRATRFVDSLFVLVPMVVGGLLVYLLTN